jgi:hypothetical protein
MQSATESANDVITSECGTWALRSREIHIRERIVMTSFADSVADWYMGPVKNGVGWAYE